MEQTISCPTENENSANVNYCRKVTSKPIANSMNFYEKNVMSIKSRNCDFAKSINQIDEENPLIQKPCDRELVNLDHTSDVKNGLSPVVWENWNPFHYNSQIIITNFCMKKMDDHNSFISVKNIDEMIVNLQKNFLVSHL